MGMIQQGWKKEDIKLIFINLENSCSELVTNKKLGENSQGIKGPVNHLHTQQAASPLK